VHSLLTHDVPNYQGPSPGGWRRVGTYASVAAKIKVSAWYLFEEATRVAEARTVLPSGQPILVHELRNYRVRRRRMTRRIQRAALASLAGLLFLAAAPAAEAQIEICATGVGCASRVGGGGMGVNIRCDRYVGGAATGTIVGTSVVMSMNVFNCSFSYAGIGQMAAGALPHATHYVVGSGASPTCQLRINTPGGSFDCTLTGSDGLPVELMDFFIEEETAPEEEDDSGDSDSP
jgi:hypothetical protein